MTAALEKRERVINHRLRLLTIAVLGAAVGFLYWSILSGWFLFVVQDQTYSYALLIPPVACGLALITIRDMGWKRFLAEAHGDRLGYMVIALGCIILLLGREALLLFAMRFSFLIVLVGFVLATLGRRNLRRLAFPLCLLLFAIPLPATIYLPLSARLQLVSSTLAGHGLDLLGVPALREGNIILLPNASLEVAQACSGIHSLFALTATATLAAYLLVDGRLAQFLIVASAVPISILFNGFRIIVTAVACYVWGPEAAQGIAHFSTGIAVFALGCALVIGLCLLFSRRQTADAKNDENTTRAAGDSARRLTTGPVVRSGWNVSAAIVLVLFGLAVQGGIHIDHQVPLQRPLSAFPLQLGKWRGRSVSISKRELESLDPSAVLTRVYESQDATAPVELYVAYYDRQDTGATMHSPMHCIPGAGWEVDGSSQQSIPSGDGESILANRLVFQRDGRRMLVIYWYMQQGEPERSQLRGVIATLWRSVLDRRSDGCLIRLSAPIATNPQETDSELMAFAQRAVPLLVHNFLPGPSSSKLLVVSKR